MGVPEAGLLDRFQPFVCFFPILLDHESAEREALGVDVQQLASQKILPLMPPGGFHFFFESSLRRFSYALRASWSFATNTLSSEWVEGSRRLRSRETALSASSWESKTPASIAEPES